MFATTPAMLRHEDIIDYSSKTGTRIYEDGCEPLTTPFEMKSSGTVICITKLQAKSNRMGWHVGTQQITKFANNSRSTSSLDIAKSAWPSSRWSARIS
jgi:hypothetical protein